MTPAEALGVGDVRFVSDRSKHRGSVRAYRYARIIVWGSGSAVLVVLISSACAVD